MFNLNQIPISPVDAISGHANVFSAFAADPGNILWAGGGVALAFAVGAVTYSDIPAETLAAVRRRHGSRDKQFDNLVVTVQAYATTWTPPIAQCVT